MIFMDKDEIVEEAPLETFYRLPHNEGKNLFLSQILVHCIARCPHREISPAKTARPCTARIAANFGHPNSRTTSMTRAS